MVLRPKHGLSLCAGGGGLDMGLGLAEPGFHTRCYVEWEEYPRRVLISAQEAGYLAPAPIWDDLTAFDARPFAGAFDTLLAGYPCQPFSAAGQRKGADDERHLWPDVARVARELGPCLNWIFLENVAGHVSLGLETVLRDIRDMGFTPAAGIFTAAETGAAHERERVFIVAYRRHPERRAEDAGRDQPDRENTGWSEGDGWVGKRGADLADAHGGQRPDEREQRGGEQRLQPEGRSSGGEGAGWHDHGVGLADASLSRLEGREWCGPSDQRDRPPASGPASELRRPLLHAPGPADMDLWRFTLDLAPDLAPALSLGHVVGVADRAAQMVAQGIMAEAAAESLVRRMADVLAARARGLRLLGNGVHPLAAAYAWRTLSAAHGLGPVDLGAAIGRGCAGTDELVGVTG